MRWLAVACLLLPRLASAEVSVGAQVGAGAQGTTSYSALELRLDAAWKRGHADLGLRGVWDDDAFRRSEWSSPWDAVTVLRDVAITGTVGDATLGAAAGALAPAYVGHVADGYRVALDDRWRTGLRLAAHSEALDAGAEIDDVLAPRLVGASLAGVIAAGWGAHGAVAIDPGTAWSGELGAFRRFAADRTRVDVGASLVVSPAPTGVAFASAALDRAGARWSIRGDARYGSEGMFGPLYRAEGVDPTLGAGAGIAAGVSGERGWLELGARRRPGLGGLYVASAGAPMGRAVQIGAWAAVARDAAAGAAELRVAWSRRLFSALHAARMLRTDEMTVTPMWSVVAWFGATSD